MNDDDLRNLFHEATADIRPEGTLDDIRTRTEKVDPMARRWFLPSLAAAAAMALVIGGAFWATRDNDRPAGAGPAGSPSASVTSDPTGVPAPDGTAMQVFFVGEGADGPRLFSEEHKVGDDDPQEDAANFSASGTPDDGDYRTYWPKDSAIEAVTMASDGTESIQVFLSKAVPDRPAGVSADQALRQVQAVVRTVQAGHASFYDGTALPPIEFIVGDQIQERVLGVSGPEYNPGNDDEVLALVSISSPTNNEKILPLKKFTVTGQAAAFEANLNWELLVGGDAVVDSGVVTAAEGGVLSPFSFDLQLEAGTYTLVVHDTDESGEGRPLNQDSKDIVIE